MRVAIVGSGPGGMTVAKLLGDAGIRVTVFEKGGYEPQQGAITPFSVAEMQRRYVDQGITIAVGSPKVSYVEASCLGGGSEVNAGLYHRTPPEVLEAWESGWGLGCVGGDALVPHFEASEAALNVCLMPFEPPLASRKLAQGAASLGWRCQEVPRWYRYTSDSDLGVRSGIRQSMTEALMPALNREFVDFKLRARVDRIAEIGSDKVRLRVVSEGGGVGESLEFDAVFVSAGSIGTPWLLKRSGLGPSWVGGNLRLHSTIKLTARFPEIVNGEDSGIPVHQVKEFSPRYSFGGSISNLPLLAAGLSDNAVNPLLLERDWRHYATYYAMISEGKGSVGVLPGIDRPIVRFKIPDKGMIQLAEALSNLGTLLLRAGAVELFPSIRGHRGLREGSPQTLPPVLDRSKCVLMTIHLMGTCPMGETPAACVDSMGRLRGTRNIYVADASIIPTALGVNPQGTLMALVRHNTGRFLMERLR